MAGKNNLIQSFFNDKGLDLRSSDLVRPSEFASDMLNEDYRKTGAINKRKGYQAKVNDVGGNGLGVYANVNLTTGAITEELVTVDDNLHRISNQTFTVTYTGSNVARMSMSLDPSTSTFKFVLTDNEVEVLNFDLGVGINEASPKTLSQLKTAVDAVTNFSSTISGSSSAVAAFIKITRDATVDSSGVAIKYIQFDQINSPLASPLANYHAQRNTDEFQNASFVNLTNVLFVSTGHDELYKYDGQTFYRAGMPKGTKPTTVDGGAGAITNSSTTHIITHIQIDNKGNVIEGIESEASTGLNITSRQVDVTVTNIENTTGFNTNCAIVAGAQTTVNTITVDDGSGGNHTMKAGDTAYFFDSVTGDYVTRNVDSVTTSTITVAGAAVTVADNAVISNNLRIAIYRNQAAGTTHSLVAEIPNNSFTTTQVYTDNVADANLGADYVQPIKPHGLPPKGKYATAFRNLLIINGVLTDVNNNFYSDIDGPEFFPAGDNQFLTETTRGDKNTGLAVNNNALFIFKDQSIHALTGDIATDQIRIDEVAGGDVGCVSHHTVTEIRGKLVFLGEKGVFGLALGDNESEEISFRVQPVFETTNSDFNLTKAVGINWFEKDKYIIFLPAELTSAGSELYTDLTKSRMLVYDYARKSWLEWNNIDFQGGAVIFNSGLYFSERRLGTVSGNVESNLYQIQDTGDTYDYADHEKAISFTHKTHWESLGMPDVFKKYLRLKLHSLDASINDFESDTFVVDVETQINYNDSESSSFSLDYGSSTTGWGEFLWGVDFWGSVRAIELKSKLKSTRARTIRIIFSNSVIHENILISGWTIEANTPFRERIKE